MLSGRGAVLSDEGEHAFEAGDAVLNLENTWHSVRNDGDETLRLLVVGGIMFVSLWPNWPTESPYEIAEPANDGTKD